jgi:hypothetical protein
MMADATSAQGKSQENTSSAVVQPQPPAVNAKPSAQSAPKPEAATAGATAKKARPRTAHKVTPAQASTAKRNTSATGPKAATRPAVAKSADSARTGAKASAKPAAKPVPTSGSRTAAATASAGGSRRKPANASPKEPADKPRIGAAPSEKAVSQPPAAPVKAPENTPTAADKQAKPKKAKLVRDSFTMPETEYDLIALVKRRCIAKGLAVKKSEVLRAATIGFAAKGDADIMAAIQSLDVIKTGRPPKKPK